CPSVNDQAEGPPERLGSPVEERDPEPLSSARPEGPEGPRSPSPRAIVSLRLGASRATPSPRGWAAEPSLDDPLALVAGSRSARLLVPGPRSARPLEARASAFAPLPRLLSPPPLSRPDPDPRSPRNTLPPVKEPPPPPEAPPPL